MSARKSLRAGAEPKQGRKLRPVLLQVLCQRSFFVARKTPLFSETFFFCLFTARYGFVMDCLPMLFLLKKYSGKKRRHGFPSVACCMNEMWIAACERQKSPSFMQESDRFPCPSMKRCTEESCGFRKKTQFLGAEVLAEYDKRQGQASMHSCRLPLGWHARRGETPEIRERSSRQDRRCGPARWKQCIPVYRT